MTSFGLNLELDLDDASLSDAGAVAFEWFEEASRVALGDARAAMDDGAPVPLSPPFVDPASWNPAGVAVTLSGSVEVSGRRAKQYGPKAMTWLREQLDGGPERAGMHFWLSAGLGPNSRQSWWPSLFVHRPEESPGWQRIGAYVAEPLFVDPAYGVEVQRLWLGLLRSFADRYNPAFGQVDYGFDTTGSTALEKALHPDLDFEYRDPEHTIAESRRWLRGYAWLTIVPAELTDRLGGAAALRASGSFHEVSELEHGGLWLQATEDYRQYGPQQVAQVFRALASVLRPGPTWQRDQIAGKPVPRVVYEDAAAYQTHESP
ncbi:hypothetical protein ACPCHT_39200 [Nucisporomicrobium flavum]|uniref:hypothetical protein n=1 Tax=Nucisporomicrobium flavum TaxID=2785915 RepID=UPI0018F2A0AB|nr:hypothetical protein [Nucisporomicrobium flavum]